MVTKPREGVRMKKTVLELFSGSKSFSNIAEKYKYKTFTIDNVEKYNPDLCIDVLNLKIKDIPFKFRRPYILWASPPCQAFSIASVSRHWHKGRIPKSEKAYISCQLVFKVFWLINRLKPKYFFIENPRGMLRKMDWMNDKNMIRKTITYCQYGDKRMKPTDIWTNLFSWNTRPMCKNGDPCHESAPRGSKTGTQGLKNAYDRSKVPVELCQEILEVINK
jgi:site-specific DNA-cytosine methylase